MIVAPWFDGLSVGGWRERGGVWAHMKKPAFSHELLWHPELGFRKRIQPTTTTPSLLLSLLVPKITHVPKGGSFSAGFSNTTVLFCWH